MPYKYCVNGREIPLTVDKDLIAVRFREPALLNIRASVIQQAKVQSFASRVEIPGEKFTIFNVPKMSRPHNICYKTIADAMNAADEVARVAPVFKVGSNHILATDRLIVGFKPQTKNAAETLQKYGYEILEGNDRKYLVQLGEFQDPFEVNSQLEALQEIAYVEPDFVILGNHATRSGCIVITTSAGYSRLVCSPRLPG